MVVFTSWNGTGQVEWVIYIYIERERERDL